MISDYALSDIEKLEKKYGRVPFADAIRLNGLGLKIQRAANCGSFYELPRVAYLGADISLREPTISHVQWIDAAINFVNKAHYETIIAVHAFALSRGAADLPDITKPKACTKAIDKFVNGDLSHFTFRQVRAAVLYALNGADIAAGEFPPGESEEDDVLKSVGCGVLLETASVGLGLSIRDISSLTIRQARELQKYAIGKAACEKVFKLKAEDDYQVALNEITERLEKEKAARDAAEHSDLSVTKDPKDPK